MMCKHSIRELGGRYTEPKLMVSDNEGAFRRASKILVTIAESPMLKTNLSKRGIEWRFLPSRASWMGGVWERLVGIVKKELMKMQGKAKFNEYEWRTHFIEIEAILNDRPLTQVSGRRTDPEAITPKCYLHGGVDDVALASDINLDEIVIDFRKKKDLNIELYEKRKEVKNTFWKKPAKSIPSDAEGG